MKKMKERGQSDPQKLGDFKALTSWPSNPWQFQGTNTIIVAAFTMATALLLLSLCGGVSAATPVLTVHSSDGDVIDCVKKMDQPSLTNPLLKNHSFQVCCVCVFFLNVYFQFCLPLVLALRAASEALRFLRIRLD
ncbi:BnaC05g08050D [Brassica napus]|uniref:BnaC05g08050D protein n=2 Tax=Brassica napus TaxID=3708 RepID=A0A078HKW2_BRANA|nr:BnaC05g08050D [Brassica napus]